MIKGIIFDFFGVICSEVAPLWSKKYFSPAQATELHDKHIVDADRGLVTEEELMDKISTLIPRTPGQIRQEWREQVYINRELVSLIEEVKPQYKIGLCTNAISAFLNPLLDESNLWGLFDSVVISDQIGHIKPEPEMYKAILAALSLAPEEAFFFDDNPKNIEGAKKIGIEGVVFTSADQLRKLF